MLTSDSTRTTFRGRRPGVQAAAAICFGANAADDWDGMHDAIAERLQAILTSTAAGGPPSEPPAQAGCTHALALECAVALHQLQATLVLERSVVRRLESELSDARAALSRAADFECGQTGESRAYSPSLHDDLTALPNRQHCRDRLDEALALAATEQTTAALLLTDLDGFKAINHRHGLEMSDKVRRIVAARLARAVRDADIVCCLGGDEFACLPSGPLYGRQLAHLAGKLFDAVSAPLTVGDLHLEVRPRIGVAIFPMHAGSTDALLRAAQSAMYRAKQQQIGVAFAERLVEIELVL